MCHAQNAERKFMITHTEMEELKMCPGLQALPKVQSTSYVKGDKILAPRFMGVKVSVSPLTYLNGIPNVKDLIEKGREELDTVLSFLVEEGFAEALLVPTSLIRFAPTGLSMDFGIVCYILADSSKPMPEYAKEYEMRDGEMKLID